jgi:hypothetical protein
MGRRLDAVISLKDDAGQAGLRARMMTRAYDVYPLAMMPVRRAICRILQQVMQGVLEMSPYSPEEFTGPPKHDDNDKGHVFERES